MAISLEQLNAFVLTVDEGGFRQAAKKLDKHPSTISNLVANLEIDLGYDLFIRHPRSLEITLQGRSMYDAARAVVWEMQHFEAKAATQLTGDPTSLTIAVDESLRDQEFADCVARVFSTFPSIELKVISGDTSLVQSWVLNGEVDIALQLYTASLDHRLSVARAYPFEVAEIVSPQLLTEPQPLAVESIRGMTQIIYQFFIDFELNESQLLSNRTIKVSNAYQVLEMVCAGLGWGSVPLFLCQKYLDDGRLLRIDIENFSTEYWHANTIWLAGKPVNAAMRCFLDEVRKIRH